jgi:hypothetical protein
MWKSSKTCAKSSSSSSSSSVATSLRSHVPTTGVQPPLCDMCDENIVSLYCSECKVSNLCEDCGLSRHEKATFKHHVVVAWSPAAVVKMCDVHNQPCLMFCREHMMAVCNLCTFGSHKVCMLSTVHLLGIHACDMYVF